MPSGERKESVHRTARATCWALHGNEKESAKSHEHQSKEGVSVTMAYAVLITLFLVCPVVRLVSVSLAASEKRR